MRFPLSVLPVLALTTPLLAGCMQNGDATAEANDDARTIDVTSSADACDLSADQAPAGTLHFEVTNTGGDVTEFYLLGDDDRVVGEVENIGPDLTRELVVKATPGTYVAACKPGMTGDGIRSDFTVTDSGESGSSSNADDRLVRAAEKRYQAYVQQQSDQLLARTAQFVRHYERGEDAAARALYPVARTHWERIETVAESFGDLDPKMDAREADLAPGQHWTGWHRIEKDLWPARAKSYEPLTPEQRKVYAEDLLDNTRILDHRIGRLHFTVDQIANGSRGLMEEVATGKVTGEEEYWSRTDLWDFQANVDGARVGWEGVRSIVRQKDPALAEQLDARFAALQHLLDEHRSGNGFVSYDDLPAAQVKALADAVNALAEPLSRLTAVVLS